MSFPCKILTALVLLFSAMLAEAHPMPNSAVTLTVGRVLVRADVVLPLAELRYALPQLGRATGTLSAMEKSLLTGYLIGHIGANDAAGGWLVSVTSVELRSSPDHADIRAELALKPASATVPPTFSFRDDAITHEVMSHIIMVFAASDARQPAGPRLIGALQNPVRAIQIVRETAAPRVGFAAAFGLGARHIADGTDHLLFLLTLLLPAPLLAVDRRWQDRRTLRGATGHLLAIVSAFTVGHSLTLVLGATIGYRLDQRPIEILIAGSIMISALNAWRPFLGARELLIAAFFGLIHGMSFAAVIGTYLVDVGPRAAAILGFNLGIEAVQIAIVLVAVPSLLILSSVRAYRYIRLAGSVFAGIAALAWVAERTSEKSNPVASLVDRLTEHAWLILAALAAAAAVVAFSQGAGRFFSGVEGRSAAGRR